MRRREPAAGELYKWSARENVVVVVVVFGSLLRRSMHAFPHDLLAPVERNNKSKLMWCGERERESRAIGFGTFSA
jgi:hypothetical protein